MAVRREPPHDLARQIRAVWRADRGPAVHAVAEVAGKPAGRAGLEAEPPARSVEGRGRHALEDVAPRADADVVRVERHLLDHGEARAEIAREDDRPVAPVQDQPGRGVDDERPRQDLRGREESRHARLALGRRGLVPPKVPQRGHGEARANVVR